MGLRDQDGTLIRGADGVLYLLTAETCERVSCDGVDDFQVEPMLVETKAAARSEGHASARMTIDPGDHVSARMTIDPGDHVSARMTIDPGDHVSARMTIDPGDHVSARMTIDPGQ